MQHCLRQWCEENSASKRQIASKRFVRCGVGAFRGCRVLPTVYLWQFCWLVHRGWGHGPASSPLLLCWLVLQRTPGRSKSCAPWNSGTSIVPSCCKRTQVVLVLSITRQQSHSTPPTYKTACCNIFLRPQSRKVLRTCLPLCIVS